MKIENYLEKCCDKCNEFVLDTTQDVLYYTHEDGSHEINSNVVTINCKDRASCDTINSVLKEQKREAVNKTKTFGDIWNEFLTEFNINQYDNNPIKDWRPCTEMYGVPFIQGAIVVWLKNGSKIIYIPKEDKEV